MRGGTGHLLGQDNDRELVYYFSCDVYTKAGPFCLVPPGRDLTLSNRNPTLRNRDPALSDRGFVIQTLDPSST